MFTAISSLLHWSDLSLREKIEVKRTLFSIADEKIRDKIVFGFFLDHFVPLTTAEASQFDKLDHLGFMAGSLTSMEFVVLLDEFLSSKEITKQLTSETIAILQEYVASIRATQEQGELVDLLRSSDFRLILHAITGKSFWSVEQTPFINQKDAVQMQEKILSEINHMQIGDKRLFLLGSLLHETRLEVRKVAEHVFELIYFDTAQEKRAQIHRIDDDKFLDPTFWRPLCEVKLGQTQETSDKVCKWIQSHISAMSSETITPESEAIIAKQQQNTCHFRSLFAPLKYRIIEVNRDKGYGGYVEWHHLKLALGAFLLCKTASRSDSHSLALHALSVKKQKIREEKQALHLEMAKATLDDSHYNLTLKGFEKAFSLFFPIPNKWKELKQDPYSKTMPHAIKELTDELIASWNALKIPPEEIAPFIKEIDHPLIQQAFFSFINQAQRQREILTSGELHKKLQEMTKPVPIISAITEFILPTAVKLSLPPLSDKELFDLMDLLIKNVNEITAVPRLSQDFLFEVLRRALRVGAFDKGYEFWEAVSRAPASINFHMPMVWELKLFTPISRPIEEMEKSSHRDIEFSSFPHLYFFQIMKTHQFEKLLALKMVGSELEFKKLAEQMSIPPEKMEELIPPILELENQGNHNFVHGLIYGFLNSLLQNKPTISFEKIVNPFPKVSKAFVFFNSQFNSLIWLREYNLGNISALSRVNYLDIPDPYLFGSPIKQIDKNFYSVAMEYLENKQTIYSGQIDCILFCRDLLFYTTTQNDKNKNREIFSLFLKKVTDFESVLKFFSTDQLVSILFQSSQDPQNKKMTSLLLSVILKREDGASEGFMNRLDPLIPDLLKQEVLIGWGEEADLFLTKGKAYAVGHPSSNVTKVYSWLLLKQEMKKLPRGPSSVNSEELARIMKKMKSYLTAASFIFSTGYYSHLTSELICRPFCPSKQAYTLLQPLYEKILNDPNTPLLLQTQIREMAKA